MKCLTKKFTVFLIVICSFGLAEQALGQLSFNISSTGDANADAGFQMAAAYWSSQFEDDVTVNVTAGFADLGGSTLASSRNGTNFFSYAAVRNALAANSSSANDSTFVNSLSTAGTINVYANRLTDNPNGSNSLTPFLTTKNQVGVNRTNQKALGLRAGDSAGEDTQITFNSNSAFSFDFDPTDGIDSDKLDFVGIAIHELGHSMGFTSYVDVVDGFGDVLALANVAPTVLDLTRYSPDSFGVNAVDFTADTRAKYFSIDGGENAATTGLNHWSLGGRSDGRQASHWKDNLGLGIMDPTAQPRGQLHVVTELDLMAIDVIGWDRISSVPEPGVACLLAGLLGMTSLIRRRTAAA
jgi:hypothetical protein